MKRKRSFIWGGVLLLCFIVFTILLETIDVQPIGPEGSAVGFAALNGWVHDAIGVHLWWYHLTDWLGLLSVMVGLGFAAVGAVQLFRRRNIWKVDREILWLGTLYIVMALCYVLFEKYPVNYRSVILEGGLEASYPSSHALLAVCVMRTAILQFERLMPKKKMLRRWGVVTCAVLMTVIVMGRMIAGVHWVTDTVGGLLLALALVELYRGVIANKKE